MRKIVVVLGMSVIPAFMVLAFVLNTDLSFFTIKPSYAQVPVDNSLPETQRLGTNNILNFPDVTILYGNGNATSLDQEFALLASNNTKAAIRNPDYGLNDTIPVLRVGQNFRINSTTDQDIVYSRVNVALVPIASLPPGTKLSDIDPEDNLTQQTPLTSVGSYIGGIGNLVIPQTTRPGYYLLDVSLHYPSQGVTAVYNTMVRIVK